MTKNERAIDRAVWLVPTSERDRYAEEWHAELIEATQPGGNPRAVVQAARKMARRRRMRHVLRALTGEMGALKAVKAWVALLLILALAPLFIAPVLFVVLVRGMTQVGVHSPFSYTLMVSSLSVGVLSAAFVWWSWGVAFDALDNFMEPAAWTNWMDQAFFLMLACGLAFVVSVVISLRRESRSSAAAPVRH